MKTLLTILAITFVLTSCNKQETQETINTTINPTLISISIDSTTSEIIRVY
jgi:PBP1b-binding outer membrane lipoprotein LpoB